MKKLFLGLTFLASLSLHAMDYELVQTCTGVNQYEKEVKAKLYLSPEEGSNEGILITVGESMSNTWESVSIGTIKDKQFQSNKVRMTLGGILYHTDYYALRGNLKCVRY